MPKYAGEFCAWSRGSCLFYCIHRNFCGKSDWKTLCCVVLLMICKQSLKQTNNKWVLMAKKRKTNGKAGEIYYLLGTELKIQLNRAYKNRQLLIVSLCRIVGK